MAMLRLDMPLGERPAWTATIRDGAAWLERKTPEPTVEVQLGPLLVKLMASPAGEGFELRLAELVEWARDLSGLQSSRAAEEEMEARGRAAREMPEPFETEDLSWGVG